MVQIGIDQNNNLGKQAFSHLQYPPNINILATLIISISKVVLIFEAHII
jgi:hypothetical protein